MARVTIGRDLIDFLWRDRRLVVETDPDAVAEAVVAALRVGADARE
jgi:very-short-patch-repair endonuclease